MNEPEPTPREIERRIDRLEQYVKDEVRSINEALGKLDAKFVSNDRFNPVAKVVFGVVALVLIAVAGALIGSVLPGGK